MSQLKGDALFKWSLGLMIINPDSAWNGAYFKVSLHIVRSNCDLLIRV